MEAGDDDPMGERLELFQKIVLGMSAIILVGVSLSSIASYGVIALTCSDEAVMPPALWFDNFSFAPVRK